MKIEMGESLMMSWLRHKQQCRIVQLNWKASPKWDLKNKDEAVTLFEKMNKEFSVFEGKFDQTIKQAEIDVLGIAYEDTALKYYAVDIAYHEQGLQYGAKDENSKRISKKILRSALVLLTYFADTSGEIIFASPKIHDASYSKLQSTMERLTNFFQKYGYNYTIKLIANNDFSHTIFEPVIEISQEVSDTSELFLRSFQLSQLCTKQNIPQNNKKNSKTNEYKQKIGEYVREKFKELFDNDKLSSEELQNLQDTSYSREHLNLSFPCLTTNRDAQKDRYYAKPYKGKYFLCNDWYARQKNF